MLSTDCKLQRARWAVLLALGAVLLVLGARAGHGFAGGGPAGAACYTLTKSVATGSGSISAMPTSSGSCPNGSYTSGYIVTLSAQPSPGWVLSAWSGTDNDGANPTFVTMNSDHAITASFSSNCRTLTKSVAGGSGTIAASPTSSGGCPSGRYSPGYIVTLSGQPGPGWVLSAWSGTDNDTTNPTSVTMNTDRTVTATFSQNCVTLTASVASGSGSITASPANAGGCGNHQYPPGYIVTLGAVASPGWVWSSWTGTDNNNMQSTTVTMNGNRSVTATFVGNCYTLTTQIGSGSGSITTVPASAGSCPNGQYSQGYVVTLIANPDSGYVLYGWNGTDNDYLLTTTVTVSSNRTVTAYFIVPGGPTPVPPTDTPTPTSTPHPPTATPTPTNTPRPPTSTPTSQPAATPTPTGTLPTAQPTETPPDPPTPPATPAGLRGDIDCNGRVDSIDAAILLQYAAALVGWVPCRTNGDVNGSGGIDSIDAALVLQYVAGLLAGL